jgi:flagellar protein FliJ
MRGFRFKLQSVLNHAEREEERRKLELAWLRVQRQEEEMKLAELQQDRTATRAEYLRRSVGPVEVDSLENLHQHLEHLDAAIAAKRHQIAKLDESILAKTAEVVEAMKKRQMLEKLRERAKTEYDLAFNRMEARLLDETTAPRYATRAPAQ